MDSGGFIGAFLFVLLLIAAAIWFIVKLVRSSPKTPEAFDVSPEEVAIAIEGFVEGRGGDHDWDDFLHWKIADPFLESVRKKCEEVTDKYPATQKGHYCSEEGVQILRALSKDVRAKATT
jgi:hypothetical protein